jgi:hypothetical protein
VLESQHTGNPKLAALIGGLFTMPFVAANAIVGNRIEPFFSFIRPGPHTSAFEYVLLVAVLGCLPVGAFIAARPLFGRAADPKWGAYALNGLVAAVMIVLFVWLSVGLATEIYRCDVLNIPNCD